MDPANLQPDDKRLQNRGLRSPRRKGEKVEVFTDGNDDYMYAFPDFFKLNSELWSVGENKG